MLTPTQATHDVLTALGGDGVADVKKVTSAKLTDDRIRTTVTLFPWTKSSSATRRAKALAHLGDVALADDDSKILVYRWPTVELRLSGLALQTLADNGHIPGWPGKVNPAEVKTTDGWDSDLHKATARWYSQSHSGRQGRGTVQTGPSSTHDASIILNYLESVSGALLGAEDATARGEGRYIGRSIDQACAHIRKSGAKVIEVQRGSFTDYKIEV